MSKKLLIMLLLVFVLVMVKRGAENTDRSGALQVRSGAHQVRIGALPVPVTIYEHGDSRMKAFPRLLDAMTDNIIYAVMLHYRKEKGEKIRIHQVSNPAILSDHGPGFEKMIEAVKKGDLAYFNKKLRDEKGVPLVNVLCIWIPVKADSKTHSTVVELHMIVLSGDYDKVAGVPSSYRVFDLLTFDVRNLDGAKMQILNTVRKQVDEFVNDLDV